LRSRVEIRRRLVNGLTQRSPSWRIVPWYRPNSWQTRASPGATWVSPNKVTNPATRTTTPTPTSTPDTTPSELAPTATSATPAAITSRATSSSGRPGVPTARRSCTRGRGISGTSWGAASRPGADPWLMAVPPSCDVQ
jgi:hypothetical protein